MDGVSTRDELQKARRRQLPPRRIGLFVTVALAWLAVDILSKVLIVAYREGHPPIKLLGGFLWISVLRNSGAAFGMATGLTWVLSLIMIAVIVAIVWMAPRLRSIGWAVGIGLILAGALGNLVDRMFRAPGPLRGRVVDFLSFMNPNGTGWAIFNLADAGICVGGALIVLLTLFGRDYDGKRGSDSGQDGDGEAADREASGA